MQNDKRELEEGHGLLAQNLRDGDLFSQNGQSIVTGTFALKDGGQGLMSKKVKWKCTFSPKMGWTKEGDMHLGPPQ